MPTVVPVELLVEDGVAVAVFDADELELLVSADMVVLLAICVISVDNEEVFDNNAELNEVLERVLERVLEVDRELVETAELVVNAVLDTIVLAIRDDIVVCSCESVFLYTIGLFVLTCDASSVIVLTA